MDINDIVLAFRFKDAKRWIPQFEHNFLFCSCFVAIDDRSEDNIGYDYFKSHMKCASIVKKTKHTIFSELCDRETLHSLCLTTGKTHMLYLDTDEKLSEIFLDEITHIPNDYNQYTAPFINLYPDENNYISEGIYANQRWHIMCKLDRLSHFDLQDIDRLHGPRFPENLNKVYSCKSPIYHYAHLDPEIVNQRYHFYTTHDPCNKYQMHGYDHILSKHAYRPLPTIKPV